MDNDTPPDSPRHVPERAMLQASLDSQRAALLRKLDGLDTEQATRRLVPSATTLLGLVKHCMDVEWWWFRAVMNGEEVPPEEEFDPLSTWRIEPGETVDSLVAAYRAEAAECARAVARYSLDDVSRRAGPTASLRWIYLHMIEELARHCGHTDILRELTDGATGV